MKEGRKEGVSKLVFYAQSSGAVVSGWSERRTEEKKRQKESKKAHHVQTGQFHSRLTLCFLLLKCRRTINTCNAVPPKWTLFLTICVLGSAFTTPAVTLVSDFFCIITQTHAVHCRPDQTREEKQECGVTKWFIEATLVWWFCSGYINFPQLDQNITIIFLRDHSLISLILSSVINRAISMVFVQSINNDADSVKI